MTWQRFAFGTTTNFLMRLGTSPVWTLSTRLLRRPIGFPAVDGWRKTRMMGVWRENSPAPTANLVEKLNVALEVSGCVPSWMAYRFYSKDLGIALNELEWRSKVKFYPDLNGSVKLSWSVMQDHWCLKYTYSIFPDSQSLYHSKLIFKFKLSDI